MKTQLDQSQKEKLENLLKLEYFSKNWKKVIGDKEINTLEDIYDALPKIIWRKKDDKYESSKLYGYYALSFSYVPAKIWSNNERPNTWDAGYYNYESSEDDAIHIFPGDSGYGCEIGDEMIDALFKLLLWVVENEYFIKWDS